MKNNKITYKCEFCGKEKTTYKSVYNKSTRHFCGHSCYIQATKGKNHYNYVGISIKCDYCGKDVETNQYKLDHYKNHFCNMDCHDKYRKELGVRGKDHPIFKQIIVNCANCGKEISRTPYDIKSNKYLYCDKQCLWEHRNKIGFYKGENNTNYKGGDIEVECAICGKQLYRAQSIVKNHSWFVCSPECRGKYIAKYMSGENSYNWDGGTIHLNHAVRASAENLNWRLDVFARDGFKCQHCKDATKRKLNAHHKKPFAKIMQENNITILDEARACKELWDINNGITLCEDCHKKLHKKYGKAKYNNKQFIEFKELKLVV